MCTCILIHSWLHCDTFTVQVSILENKPFLCFAVANSFGPEKDNEPEAWELLKTFGKHLKRIRLVQLPSRLNPGILIEATEGFLDELALSYGRQSVGTQYEKEMFGMRLVDCRNLSKALETSKSLTQLRLSSSRLDDDKVLLIVR